MKVKKSLLCFSLIIIMTFSILFAGCNKSTSSGTPPKSGNDASDKSPVNLTVWIYGWETDSVKVLQEDAAEWQKNHPNYKIQMVPVASDVYQNKMQATVAGGSNPDIAFIDAGQLSTQLAAKGKLLALDDFGATSYKDLFYPAVWDNFVYNGKVYGLRLTSNNLALFYNKTLFDKAGVKYPDENWTWDDLRDAAKKLTDPSKKQYGLELPIYNKDGGYTWTWLPFLWQNDGQLLNEDRTEAAFNSPEGKESLEFWYQLVNVDKSAPKEAPAAGVNRFLSGQSAMSVDGPWMLRVYCQDPNFKDKFDVAPLPKKKESATVLGGEGWVIFSNTKYPKEAYEYVQHLSIDDEFVQKFWKAWFTIPPMKKYADFYNDDPVYGKYMKVFSKQMEVVRSRQFTDTWPQITDALGLKIGEYMLKGKPVDEALKGAEEEVNKLLKQN